MSGIKKLTEIGEKLADLAENYSKLSWTQYTTGFDFGINEAYQKLMTVYQDKKNFDLISEYLEKDLSSEDKRRVELIYNSFKDYHLKPELSELDLKIQKQTTKLSQVLNTHRPVFEGRPISSVELSDIVTNDPDEKRRKEAYFARNQVNKPLIEAGFIELLNLRKEYAKVYGASDFVGYSLTKSELNPEIFKSWKDETRVVKEKINQERSRYALKYLGKEELNPWDAAYMYSKMAPLTQTKVDMMNFYEPVRKLFAKFGFDITKNNVTYDVYSRKNKSEWGYQFTIRHGVDSRILANVKNRYDEFGVLLHETGHAVHAFGTDPNDVLMNYGISGIISEGIANLFGGYLEHEEFYKEFFTDNLTNAKEQFQDVRRWSNINHIRSVVRIMFDQDLYRTKIEKLDDIHNLLWNLEEDLTGFTVKDQDPVWGSTIHHTTHPIYLHNYFMGDVTAAMLKGVFRKEHNIQDEMEEGLGFGKFLDEKVIKPAGRYKYAELFKMISGDNFSLKWITDKI